MTDFRQPFKGDYPITQAYGVVIPGVTYKDRPHSGIDYGCPEGTEILASADGTVKLSTFDGDGYGKYIIILHDNGVATLYAHLQGRYVTENQKVCQGQVIGISGNTGNSTGPHLHFEARRVWYDWKSHFNPMDLPLKSFADTHSTTQDAPGEVLEPNPDNNTPEPAKPQFEPVRAGFCKVVCDVANVRCHCDMNRVLGTLKKGDVLSIGGDVTVWNGLPYRDYYDPRYNCWLRIAEHDPYTQMIVNTEI